VILAGGGAAFARMHKQVTLVVDGQPHAVATFGSTVGELLSSEGIVLSEHDEVTPAPGAPLGEDMRIEVQVAKEITLLLNGVERTLFVTGQTVEDVLEHVNLRIDQHSLVRPSRAATIEDGDVIVYREALSVEVGADGKTRTVVTNALTVRNLLADLGIEVDGRDRFEPPLGRGLEGGMSIRVTRIDVRREVEEHVIPFQTEVRQTDSLPAGQQEVVREGGNGLERVVYRVREQDGEVVAKQEISRRVVREPENRVVREGTYQPPASSSSSSSSSSAGSGNTESGVATWYERDGMVAAHKTLPFGTEVRVTNLGNGRSVTVVINDRGPYAEGRIIDLGDDAFEQLAPLSWGTINVRITW
jgi:resuscitation-promoting factor RpfB